MLSTTRIAGGTSRDRCALWQLERRLERRWGLWSQWLKSGSSKVRWHQTSRGKTMKREYHKWSSPALGRDMKLLVFGHAGLPALVFPSSCGSFFEFEDRGMINVVHEKLEQGRLQLFCVDSVDSESWYNLAVPPRWRIARHMQYEQYLMQEVLPLIRQHNPSSQLAAIGCSFGGDPA